MGRRVCISLLLAALAASTQGCALMMFEGGHEGGSGSLSDAAAMASTDSTHRYKVDPPDVGYTTPPPEREVVVVEPSAVAPSGEPGVGAVLPPRHEPPAKTHRMFVSVVGGGGVLGGRAYDGFGSGGISVGGYPEPRVRVDGVLTANTLAFREQAYLYHSFKDPGEINLDVVGRFYLTPDKTFMGIYPLAGVGTGTLMWNYAQPVTVIEDGRPRVINDDRINYFSFFGGAGMSLMQTRFVHIGGNASAGVRIYGWHTGSGLQNDMLKPTGYMRVLLELSFYVTKT